MNPMNEPAKPDIDARFRAMEEKIARVEEFLNVYPYGFEFEIEPGQEVIRAVIPYDSGFFYGMITLPNDALRIRSIQIGRCEFVPGEKLSTLIDFRRVGVSSVHGPTMCHPSMGISIRFQNVGTAPIRVHGAVYLTHPQWKREMLPPPQQPDFRAIP